MPPCRPTLWPTVMQQGHRVGCRGADDAILSLGVANDCFNLADGFVLPHVLNLYRRGYDFADRYRFDEPPTRFEKNSTGPRQVLGDDGVQQSGCDAALNDQAAEGRLGRQVGIVVDRVPVAGHLGEHLDVTHRRLPHSFGSCTDLGPAGDCAGPWGVLHAHRFLLCFHAALLRAAGSRAM